MLKFDLADQKTRMGLMKRWIAVRILGALVTVAGLAGCGTLSGGAMANSPDELLAAEVTNRLENDPLTGRTYIGVSVTDGVVTLAGNISDENVRIRARGIARSTDGVKGIVDDFFPRR
jgi:osmotically-inducible protein OsmY